MLRPLSPLLLVWLLVGCSWLGGKPAQVQTPDGWVHSPNNSAVQILEAQEKTPSYQIQFERTGDFDQAMDYVRLAESIYPTRAQVLYGLDGQRAPKINPWYFERLWWYEEKEGVKKIYAVTADAVSWLLNRYVATKARIKGEKAQAKDWKGANELRVEFSYQAKASLLEPLAEGQAPPENWQPQVKVTLELKYFEFCGQPCGWGLVKSREVIFKGKQRVLSITGDNTSGNWESSPQEPYAPGQWIRY